MLGFHGIELATIFFILTQANDDSLRLVATHLVRPDGIEPPLLSS